MITIKFHYWLAATQSGHESSEVEWSIVQELPVVPRIGEKVCLPSGHKEAVEPYEVVDVMYKPHENYTSSCINVFVRAYHGRKWQ